MGYNPVLAFFLFTGMTEERRAQLAEEYNAAMERPRRVYEIFCDYFGEDKVDMQGFETLEQYIFNGRDSITSFRIFLLVWFPEVTVTNENDRSVDIQDLYMKVAIGADGSMVGSPAMNRATYPLDQFLSDFMHSHTPGINKNSPSSFQRICTGSGPIQRTIGNLNGEFDEDLWQLFCSELEDFVHVESLSGVPYRRLEKIGITDKKVEVLMGFPYVIAGELNHNRFVNSIPTEKENRTYNLIADFTRYLLKEGGLPMEFANGNYSVGMSYIDCTIYLSNKFIEWYNREDNPYRRILSLESLVTYEILGKHLIKEGKLYISSIANEMMNVEQYEGNRICTFKGMPVLRHIFIQEVPSEGNLPLFLCGKIVRNIVGAIVKVVNYRYGREREEQSESGGQAIYL